MCSIHLLDRLEFYQMPQRPSEQVFPKFVHQPYFHCHPQHNCPSIECGFHDLDPKEEVDRNKLLFYMCNEIYLALFSLVDQASEALLDLFKYWNCIIAIKLFFHGNYLPTILKSNKTYENQYALCYHVSLLSPLNN